MACVIGCSDVSVNASTYQSRQMGSVKRYRKEVSLMHF